MASSKTKKDRNQFVVKANDLIRKTRYDLTAQQQKIVLYAISKIRPQDSIETEYEFSIADFCDACGLNMDAGGYYYKAIEDDLQRLTQRTWCRIPLDDDKERLTTISWIGDADILPIRGTIKIRFNKNMEPFLFELKNRYTQYRLENVLVLRSKYSIRLYEILRSYTTQKAIDYLEEKTATFTLDELKEVLCVEDAYPRWVDFDRFILRKAVKEINECAEDIHIEYGMVKTGRRATGVSFTISTAKIRQQIDARKEKEKRLK